MTGTKAEKAYELGKEYEQTFRGCGQCVIAALQDTFDVRNDDIFKAATGLAGGGARATDSGCGAYVGAVLFLGSRLGRERANVQDAEGVRHRNLELVMKLRNRFIREYGSVVCRNIQTRVLGRPYYLADPEDFQKFEDAGGHADSGCPEVVGKAARWTVEIMLEAGLFAGP